MGKNNYSGKIPFNLKHNFVVYEIINEKGEIFINENLPLLEWAKENNYSYTSLDKLRKNNIEIQLPYKNWKLKKLYIKNKHFQRDDSYLYILFNLTKPGIFEYNKYKFNETDLNNIVKQLLIGSPIFTPKDLNEWVQKMPTVFSKRFGEGQKGLANYRAFIGYFVEFLVTEAFDDNLAEEGYLEDSQMAICAYGVLQKLHTFKTNSFIEVIEDEVERFII